MTPARHTPCLRQHAAARWQARRHNAAAQQRAAVEGKGSFAHVVVPPATPATCAQRSQERHVAAAHSRRKAMLNAIQNVTRKIYVKHQPNTMQSKASQNMCHNVYHARQRVCHVAKRRQRQMFFMPQKMSCCHGARPACARQVFVVKHKTCQWPHATSNMSMSMSCTCLLERKTVTPIIEKGRESGGEVLSCIRL